MREIKFRGMSIDGGWNYGFLTVLNRNYMRIEKGHYISNSSGLPFAYHVRPETVGQYTGLKDKNGKEIYENDIIEIKGHPFEGAMKIDNNYRVSFNERMELCAGSWLLHRVLYCSEVIGNMMEHPHLLEGRDEA